MMSIIKLNQARYHVLKTESSVSLHAIDTMWCHNGLAKRKRGKPMGLKELRKQREYTQVQLSKRSGIPRSVISDYETGIRDVHNMTLATAKSLCDALNCHPYDLLG